MEKGWIKIFETTSPLKAEILIEILDQSNIKGVVLNKKDSSYHTLGNVFVYVNEEDADEAKEILKKSEL